MVSTCAKLVLMVAVCAASLMQAGCTSPWTATAAHTESTNYATTGAENALHPAKLENPSSEEMDLAAVLDKLQQIRAIDPTAEQALVEKLRESPAASWPLVTEQFRASLAYREQLTAKSRAADNLPDSTTANDRALGAVSSTPVGALMDPRSMDSKLASVRDRAASMHAAMQAPLDDDVPPASFTADGVVEAMSGATVLRAEESSNSAARVAQQTAYTMQSTPDKTKAEEDWMQLVERAADDLSQRVVDYPSNSAEVHQHVSLRLLRLLAGDTEGAVERIPNISPGEQDYWSRQQFALATYLDHRTQSDDKRRAAAAALHLDEAVSHLRELGSLSLRNLAFCKNVHGFGAIEPYEKDSFTAGSEVTLYVEVENYHSESTEKGFCTALGSTYELLNDQGERVIGGEFPDVNDCCRGRRRDFHIQYGIALPRTMSPGRYRLLLVVKDRQSDKMGQATAEFEIR